MSTYKKGDLIKVLDHGHVRLIDWMGDDTAIAEAARISHDQGSKGEEADRKLLKYLAANKHTSPFEMVVVKLEFKMPIFIQRQYIRHRMQSVNEVSARYTELPEEYYIPERWRKQDTKNRQGSLMEEWPELDHGYWSKLVEDHCGEAFDTYHFILEKGIAREMARMHLPLNTYTRWFAKWDLHNLIHWMNLRVDNHAQKEHRQYAKAVFAFLKDLFPWTMQIWQEGLMEAKMTRAKAEILDSVCAMVATEIEMTGEKQNNYLKSLAEFVTAKLCEAEHEAKQSIDLEL